MRKLLTLTLILCTVTLFAEMRGGAQYDPGAARSSLSNVDVTATPSMTSITLSDKVRAAWADILGDIYASGTVKVSIGTAAAPAYSFGSDPDTGIYSPGANILGFGVAGAENARISPAGNVLIATSTDDGANKLQVNGFSKFGEAATGIKMKVLTGTTAAAEGGASSVSHGLNSNKIVSWRVHVNHAANEYIGENYPEAGYQFKTVLVENTINVLLSATESENILEKPLKILVWYVE